MENKLEAVIDIQAGYWNHGFILKMFNTTAYVVWFHVYFLSLFTNTIIFFIKTRFGPFDSGYF